MPDLTHRHYCPSCTGYLQLKADTLECCIFYNFENDHYKSVFVDHIKNLNDLLIFLITKKKYYIAFVIIKTKYKCKHIIRKDKEILKHI